MSYRIVLSIALSAMFMQLSFQVWVVQDTSPAGDVFSPALVCDGCNDFYRQTGGD